MSRCFLSVYCPGIAAGRLKPLVEWCDHYSPLAAQDGDDGAILDISGCAHLFGGEGPLLLDLQRRLHRMRIESRAAIADTWGAAWALARFSDRHIVHGEHMIPALHPLPVEALRLPAEAISNLRRLGLVTIASVRKIPRRSLSVRFGAALLKCLDQTFQAAEDPLTPWRPPAAYRAIRLLAEPVSNTGSVENLLEDMLKEVCTRLEKDHLGSRHMDLACYRVDGTVDRCEVRTSKPSRAIRHLMRLFSGRVEKLRADFGFETFVLSVPDVEPLLPMQLSLMSSDKADEEETFDLLVDRLGMRLGFSEVNQIRVRESYLPEYAVELRPAAEATLASAEWPGYRIRPIRLIDPPMPIEVSSTTFSIGRRVYQVARLEGPERLSEEWWREPGSRWKARDYYRVEDNHGFRFWIFCDPSRRWFLHGHFA